MDALINHQDKCEQLLGELVSARARGSGTGLRKEASNLFRHRAPFGKSHIDVRRFDQVLRVDRERSVAEVEDMTTYETIVEETLKYGQLQSGQEVAWFDLAANAIE